jgi:hypothetical protein
VTSSTTELDSTLQRFARQAQSLTMAGGAAIALARSEAPDGAHSGDEMTCRASAGEDAPDVGAGLRLGAGFASECFGEGKPLRCDDSETDTRVDRDRCRKLGIRSIVAVPLKNDESVLGIIEIFSPRTKAFTESHMAKLHVLAERVTSAVEDAKNPTPPMPAVPRAEMDWADVFVDSSLPWRRLLQSAVCHLVVVVAVWNISSNWAKSERILKPTVSPHSQLTYYPNPPTFPAAGTHRPQDAAAAKVEVQSAQSAAMVVKAAGARQIIVPPTVKFSARGRLNLAAGSPNIPAMSRSRELRLGRDSIVAPAPQVGEAFRRNGVTAPNSAVVAPSPSIEGVVHMAATMNVGHSAVVGPAPAMPLHEGSVGSGMTMGRGDAVVGPPPAMPSREHSIILSAGLGGSGTVVGPPPGMPLHDGSVGWGVAMGGSSAVVGPAPGMPSREGSSIWSVGLGGSGTVVGPAPGMPSHEGPGVAGVMMGGSGAIVGPPPGMPSRDPGISASGLGGTGTLVAPPPPSVVGSGGLGSGDNASSGSGSQGVALSPSGAATTSIADGARGAAMITRSAVTTLPPKIDDPAGRVIPDLPVRVLGLALALPSSSFFSNYEVFLAERQIPQNELQLIKLVFESRPTQRRVSEYGVKDSKIVRLRVKRDPTCDETAAQVTGNHLSELQNSSPDEALRSTGADSLLPCYRTTADDYQKTVERRR